MNQEKVQLGYRERDKLFRKYFAELKIKVALNWFELFALLAVSGFVGFKLLSYFNVCSKVNCVLYSSVIAVVITLSFCFIRKYKLAINRFDKERIYKRVSSELLGSKEGSN